MTLPIRHASGRFLTNDPENLNIAMKYVEENPNGSDLDVAGICDSTGRVLGVMPHPEAFVSDLQAPEHVESKKGLKIFENVVEYLDQR